MVTVTRPQRSNLGFAVPYMPSSFPFEWKDMALLALGALLIYQLFFGRSAKRGRRVRKAASEDYRKQLAEAKKRYRARLQEA